MKTTRLFTLTAAALLSSAIGFAQAGAVDALKKFNNDADGISGNFSQTVHSKKKTQTTYGTFKILRPWLVQMGIHQTLQTNHRRRRQKPFGSMT